MKTDKNGCSTCKAGEEQHEVVKKGTTHFVQYDYRHIDGELFSVCAVNLFVARKQRDEWLAKRDMFYETNPDHIVEVINDRNDPTVSVLEIAEHRAKVLSTIYPTKDFRVISTAASHDCMIVLAAYKLKDTEVEEYCYWNGNNMLNKIKTTPESPANLSDQR
jgi:hypothetical protein